MSSSDHVTRIPHMAAWWQGPTMRSLAPAPAAAPIALRPATTIGRPAASTRTTEVSVDGATTAEGMTRLPARRRRASWRRTRGDEVAALGFSQLPPRAPELQLLHRWLDSW